MRAASSTGWSKSRCGAPARVPATRAASSHRSVGHATSGGGGTLSLPTDGEARCLVEERLDRCRFEHVVDVEECRMWHRQISRTSPTISPARSAASARATRRGGTFVPTMATP